VEDRPAHVAQAVVQGVRQRMDHRRLSVAGDDDRRSAVGPQVGDEGGDPGRVGRGRRVVDGGSDGDPTPAAMARAIGSTSLGRAGRRWSATLPVTVGVLSMA
jgi:hypothetical protein